MHLAPCGFLAVARSDVLFRGTSASQQTSPSQLTGLQCSPFTTTPLLTHENNQKAGIKV